MGQLTVRTSDKGWLRSLAKAYQSRTPALIIDDASVGIDPSSQTLFEMGRHAKLSKSEYAGVAIAVGISGVGVGLIVFAFVDPEPTSKLGALVLGGVACVLTGGLSGIHILTKHKPPKVAIGPRGIEISWE